MAVFQEFRHIFSRYNIIRHISIFITYDNWLIDANKIVTEKKQQLKRAGKSKEDVGKIKEELRKSKEDLRRSKSGELAECTCEDTAQIRPSFSTNSLAPDMVS